jgi:hypothetical protein
VGGIISQRVIAGHSRSKNGIASLAYDPAIHVAFSTRSDVQRCLHQRDVSMDARVKPAHDEWLSA